ncbi:hypothetical protein ACLB2K_007617 [Fragaria x ananassa]
MFSGQQTKGYKACPVYLDDVNSSHHADKICFLGSRRHLDEDHKWRWDAEDGTEEHNLKPLGRSDTTYWMLSSHQTKGYKTCLVCLDDVNSSHHADKICFLGSRRHLDEDHKWRWDAEDETEEHNLKPLWRSGKWILERFNQHLFRYLSTSKEITNLNPPTPDEFKYWTHKSVFFELPYRSTMKIRHNLDVMHIEKNVYDSVLGTIMNLKDNNKDTPKARVDLRKMGIRPKLWLV